MLESILAMIGPMLGHLVFAGAAAALGAAARYFVRKSNSDVLDSLLYRAESMASEVVRELDQTVVGALKAESADGKLSAEDAESVLSQAMAYLRANLGAKMLKQLEKHAGSEGAANGLLQTYLESAVHGHRPRG